MDIGRERGQPPVPVIAGRSRVMPRTAPVAAVVLTYNEQDNLPACLASLRGLDCELFVVDSGSTDRTVEIAEAGGATVLRHPFGNYATQRNWAQSHVPSAA